MASLANLTFILALIFVDHACAQEAESCYGPGSIATSVLLTLLFAVLLAIGGYLWLKKYRQKKDQLILENDPEKGTKSEFAFDNHAFKDTSVISSEKNSKVDTPKQKIWNQWSPLSAITTKLDKKRTVDDSSIENVETKIVALKSQDFTGLGFTVCGTMKDGIFVRDVLQHGPAYDSGQLLPGDRISSITISFEHIVLEDALTILSYASPYDVIFEVKSTGKSSGTLQNQKARRPSHPVYRSSSFATNTNSAESRNNLDVSNFNKKSQINNENLKSQLEQKILCETPKKNDIEVQKSENKFQKFGVKVFPIEDQQKSPKIIEQNDNNVNIEKNINGIDEPDNEIKKPQAKKREKKPEVFEREGSLIKRDENGIPQEIPNYMLNAAVAARNNRKSSNEEEDSSKTTPKKLKGKAPSPPNDSLQSSPKSKDYNSDSDIETDNQSSVNTIELNSSDITVHQSSESEEKQGRKTASTGDLSKIKNPRKTSTGTLERAQSLDITDAGMPVLKRSKEEYDLIDKNIIISKEPRLSLILDGLNTFQRNKLKKSTEWGNLEDAILYNESDVEDKEKEFDAVLNKANEIKRESQEIEIPKEIIEKYRSENQENKIEKVVKNQIWPPEVDDEISSKVIKPARKYEKVEKTEKNEPTFFEEVELRKPPQPSERQKKDDIVEKSSPIMFERKVNLDSSEHYLRRQQISPEPTSLPPIDYDDEIQLIRPFFVNDNKSEIEENVIQNFESVPSKNSNRKSAIEIIREKWEQSINNTSPPASLEAIDEDVSKDNVNIINSSDEIKEKMIPNGKEIVDMTQNFLTTEKTNYNDDVYIKNVYDINASDDLKVSRHTFDKKKDEIKHISNISVSNDNVNSNLHSLEFSVNEGNELYTTALDESNLNDSKVTISTPDIIKNVTLTEAITTLNSEGDINDDSELTNKSLTYITEIQVVTPDNTNNNVSEIEIVPSKDKLETTLENDFENYVKNFESKLDTFEKIEDIIINSDEPTSLILNDKTEIEKEVTKIHEIAEEQLKKLPEMRFTTSSYESHIKPPEKRHSFEQIRSNFEKSPSNKKENISKSRIPIATTAKTPPMSPERRDSRNLENESDRALLELMSSNIHTSTPYNSKIKPPSKNITVTSIRNSKIPSGLPTLSGGKPPLPPRKSENGSGDNNVQVSTNGNVESSFKQWVFNPSNVTNVTVENSKDKVM